MSDKPQLDGCCILVVEDDYLVSEALIDLLSEAGAKVIGPVGRLDKALETISLRASDIDCAVLDINLHGQKSYPAAEVLSLKSIPFVFSTGYSGEAIPENYRTYPRFEKPFNEVSLIAALAGACGITGC